MSNKRRDKRGENCPIEERELDEILANLVKNAKLYPPGSQERKQVLINLSQEIFFQYFRITRYASKRIDKYQQPFRQEITELALSKFMLDLCENEKILEDYDPSKGVKFLSWLVIKFEKPGGFFDKAYSEVIMFGSQKKYRRCLKEITSYELTTDNLWSSLEPTNAQELLKEIQEDPRDIFKNKVMLHTPQVNWRDLALKRMEKRWKQIAEEDYRDLGVKPSALSNFFFRAMENDWEIKAILEKYGERQKRSQNK